MQVSRRGVLGGAALLLSSCAGRFGAPPALDALAAGVPDGVIGMDDGAGLPYRAWVPERARGVVVALHGFTDSRDFMEIPAPAFRTAGMAIYAPDQRGFGAAPGRGYWAGSARMARDAAGCVAWARARHPGLPVYLIGESMGGAAAVLAAPQCGPVAVGLMAPAVWRHAVMSPLYRAGLWVGGNVVPSYLATGRDVPFPIVACDNRAALVRMARDPLTLREVRLDMMVGLAELMDNAADGLGAIGVPCLWMYGAHDQLVPSAVTLDGWKRAPGVRFAYYDDGYHMLLRDHEAAVPTRDLLGFLRDPGVPLVSGAEVAAAAWRAGAD